MYCICIWTALTLTFPVLHSTVPDLSTLFKVVNSHAPFYTIHEYQCYWYAGATFEVIKLEVDAKPFDEAATSQL